MAMTEFLHNIQTVRNLLYLHLAPHLGNKQLLRERLPLDYAHLKATAPLWLSTRVVSGFDPTEFNYLPDEERDDLVAAVREFQTVTEEAAVREPTPDEMVKAIIQLLTIIALLDKGELDSEGLGLLGCLYAAKKSFPAFALGFDYSLDTDATGEPGIWIWVLVPDEVDPDSKEFRQFVTWFPKAVRSALGQAKSDRLAYIHYRPLSEAIGLMSEGVA